MDKSCLSMPAALYNPISRIFMHQTSVVIGLSSPGSVSVPASLRIPTFSFVLTVRITHAEHENSINTP